jgi:hypothetical protein
MSADAAPPGARYRCNTDHPAINFPLLFLMIYSGILIFTVLQLGMLAYRFSLEDEAAFSDELVVELQPVQNRVEAV